MKFDVIIDTLGPVVYNGIDAADEEDAAAIALDWFAEYVPYLKVTKAE